MSLITKSPAGISLIQSLFEPYNERQIELTPTKKTIDGAYHPKRLLKRQGVIYLNISVTFYAGSEVKAKKTPTTKERDQSGS